jgi:hypothetical protein
MQLCREKQLSCGKVSCTLHDCQHLWRKRKDKTRKVFVLVIVLILVNFAKVSLLKLLRENKPQGWFCRKEAWLKMCFLKVDLSSQLEKMPPNNLLNFGPVLKGNPRLRDEGRGH